MESQVCEADIPCLSLSPRRYYSLCYGPLSFLILGSLQSIKSWDSLTLLQMVDLDSNELTGLPSLSLIKTNTTLRTYHHFKHNIYCIIGELPPDFKSWINIQKFYVNNNQIGGLYIVSRDSLIHPPIYEYYSHTISTLFSTLHLHCIGVLPPDFKSWINIQEFYVSNNLIGG